jgi:hypothetical protein
MQIGLGCAGVRVRISRIFLFHFSLSFSLRQQRLPYVLCAINNWFLSRLGMRHNSLLVFFSRATPTCKLRGENCASLQDKDSF